ncbi:MAG: hypothetical protein JNK25_11425 [Phycisphaerae bacterium]|nr:hypothetical protein [Phycisphaerae bacterium]
MNGHGAGWCVDAGDRLDLLLVHLLVDQEVAGLDELGGGEAPLVAAAHEERVLGLCYLMTIRNDCTVNGYASGGGT